MVNVRLLKNKNKLKIGCFYKYIGKNSRYFVGVFDKTIIPLVLIGYEMIIANLYPMCSGGIIVKYLFKNILSGSA